MRMTQKGQVTVPKDVRDKLGVGPGSNVEFEEHGGKFVLVNLDQRRGESRGERIARRLVEFGDKARREGWLNDLTTDEIMDMTRGPFDDANSR